MAYGREADTKFYWKLTPHIFRYGHMDGAVGGTLLPGVHTVNEGTRADRRGEHFLTWFTAISASSFVEIIRFFTALIMNVDESPLV